jgi:hypothetical protein
MSNTLKTLSDGDIVRKCLDSFHNKLTFLKTINRQYDSRFAQEGAKNGGTLLIRNPNEYTVNTGATMVVQDQAETTQTLTLATQKNVAMSFSSAERTLSIDDFTTRFIDPAMSRLAAEVEYTVLSNVYKDVANYSGTPATTPASLAAVLNAGVKLTNNLAPRDGRSLLLDPTAMAAVTASVSSYFQKASEIEKAFSDGFMGRASGFDWYESAMTPSHTNGTRTDATPVCDISTITNGATTITTTGMGSLTLKAGDVFTIADVYEMNRETKQQYSYLKQFVVTADMTCDGTDVISISPAIYVSGAKQNAYASAWTGSKALVFVAAGGSGAASLTAVQNLAYHRDAFTFVTADLEMPDSGKAVKAVFDGVSMRMWKSSDIINDVHPTRIDVLFGYKTIRPEWACRVRG